MKTASIKFVGSSHIAEQSVREIKRNIHGLKPDIVAVELDAGRYHGLFSKRKKLRLRDVRSIGVFGWLFAWIGSALQRYLGHKVGIAPGSDMKVAIEESRKIGAQVALIDRDIRITIHRLSTKVPMMEKLKLGVYLLFGWILPGERRRLKKVDLKKVPSEKILVDILQELKERFPHIYKVLVRERDIYMAKSLRHLALKFPNATILVVVGAGHKAELEKLINS